jgi:hypothetical protein
MSNMGSGVRRPPDHHRGSTPDRFGARISAALLDALGDATALVEQMLHALDSRAPVEQAQGVLVERRGCDADAAFAELVRISPRVNIKVRDIAADLLDEVSTRRSAVAGRSG